MNVHFEGTVSDDCSETVNTDGLSTKLFIYPISDSFSGTGHHQYISMLP